MNRGLCFVVACAFLQISCGGQSAGFGAPAELAANLEVASMGGVWNGTVTGLPGNAGAAIIGVSVSDGRFRFVNLNSGAQFAGTAIVSGGSTVSGTGQVVAPKRETWSDGSLVSNFEVNGTIGNRRSMFLFWKSLSGDEGEISFVYDASHDVSSSIEALEGTWTVFDELAITIDRDGLIDGQDSDGCIYSGMVTIIAQELNVYDLLITIASCDNLNGSYQGLGTIIQLGLDQVFLVQVSSENRFLSLELRN